MNCVIDWNAIASWAQVAVLTIGFYFTGKQIKLQATDSRVRVVFDLKNSFLGFQQVTTNLRPGGIWHQSIGNDVDSWSMIDHYLGLFEHCEYLISLNVMDSEYFKRSYVVMLRNAIEHPEIKPKVLHEKEFWPDLFSLCKRMGINI